MTTLLVLAFVATVHCSCPEPVSCKFIGSPAQRFAFEGDTYDIPKSGVIEVMSERHNGCESSPRAMRVINRETLKGDRFGMWTMRLPQPKPEPVHEITEEEYRKLVRATTHYVDCWTRYYSDGSYEMFNGCNTVSCGSDGSCSSTLLACPNTACSATTTAKPSKTKP